MRYYWDYDADSRRMGYSKRVPNIGFIPYPGPRGWFSLDPQYSFPGLNPGIGASFTHISLSRIFHGAVTYKDGELERINLPEGYITPNGTFSAYYHDYQGNVRAVGTGGEYGTPLQITHYYPYGLPYAEGLGASLNRYKYTGKELITEDNLNFYDFDARMYQPQSAMWMRPDDLAEKKYWVSPYSFCRSNPIFYIDPSGCMEWPIPNTHNEAKGRSHLNNFGRPRGKKRTHQGLDMNIGSGSQDLGAPVYATHDGVVDRIASYKDGDGGGNRVRIRGSNGVQTYYMHLYRVDPNLKVGDEVKEGQQIGEVGGSGNNDLFGQQVHLHYEIIVNGVHINPAIDEFHVVDAQILQGGNSNNPIEVNRTLDEVVVVGVMPPPPEPQRLEVVVKPVTPDAAIINQ